MLHLPTAYNLTEAHDTKFKYQIYRFCNIYNTLVVLGACPMVAYARAHA